MQTLMAMGMGYRSSRILLDRGRTHLHRIEDFLNGMIDSLWLADENLFIPGSDDLSVIKELSRKVIRVGTYSLKRLVDDWKELHNWIFHTYAWTDTIGELKTPETGNVFLRLRTTSLYRRILGGTSRPVDQKIAQDLSHIISSRQFPYMGELTEKDSQDKFKKVLTSNFKPSKEIVSELRAAARRIGSKCRHFRQGKPTSEDAIHVSVTSTGEIEHGIRKGGQAAAVLSDFKRILECQPIRDYIEETPFGRVEHMARRPIWTYLFRSAEDIELIGISLRYQGIKFLERVVTKQGDEDAEVPGLDEATGHQMLYVAYKCYMEETQGYHINCRAEVVPEMGNKARWVTLTPWWVNVLQAPFSHYLIDALKYHPAVFSSFHRQDQAWEASKGLAKRGPLRENEWVLSSDLKDATNAQTWPVTRGLIHGFLEGFKGTCSWQYINIVMDMIGPRYVHFPNGEGVLSTVGIMMGEAIAKPSLTLLNLAIEERAFILSHGNILLLYSNRYDPNGRRYIHIGGDDHIAVGERGYLDMITDGHRAAGSHISPGQHGYSRRLVKYTERLLNLENLRFRKIIDTEDHNRSIIVDSIKVRLMERGSTSQHVREDKNTAIGKSMTFGGCIRWLPKDQIFWPRWKLESIRSLFVNRMGSFLPSMHKHPGLFNHILLPKQVGGLELYLDGEILDAVKRSPLLTRLIISCISRGINVSDEMRKMRRLNTNPSVRGVSSIKELQEELCDHIYSQPETYGLISFKEVQGMYPLIEVGDNRRLLHRANMDGIVTVEEFSKRIKRGTLFQTLLLQAEPIKNYNTRPIDQTYSSLWNQLTETLIEKSGYCLDLAEGETEVSLLRKIKSLGPESFVRIPASDEDDFYYIRGILQEGRLGMPHLQVGHRFIGLNPFGYRPKAMPD